MKRAALFLIIGLLLVGLISAFYYRDDIRNLLAYDPGDWPTYEPGGTSVSQVLPNSNEATSSVASLTISASTTPKDDVASYTLPSAKDAIKNATFVKSLVSSDGAQRGDIYVSYVTGTTSAISALYVVNKVNGNDEVVYAIESNVFLNTAGEDFNVGREGLFGYSFTVRNDSFSVDPLYEGGKYDAEGILIQWYKDDNVFAVSPHSLAEMGATLVHTFKTPNGKEIARLYEERDDAGRITNFDFAKKGEGARERDVYDIDLYGFHNDLVPAGQRAKIDIDMTPYDLASYQVVSLGSDYLVIRPLPQNGKPATGDVTVKWSYTNQSFEVLQEGH